MDRRVRVLMPTLPGWVEAIARIVTGTAAGEKKRQTLSVQTNAGEQDGGG